MSLKIEFVERASKPGVRMAPLCRQYGISRETGYKWLNRFKRDGYAGLEEQSRRPRSCPLATAEDLVHEILQAREAHPRWGAKKLCLLLKRKYEDQAPSVSTIARILRRFGQIRRRRAPRQLSVIDRAPEVTSTAPNDTWTVDFKGWWRVRDGQRCEPLTVRDAFSRFLLAVRVMASTQGEGVRRVFEQLFRKYGLPKVIQCDNGSPFINVLARGGLTRLSAWWISLGIRVVRSRPGCPQDNGGHERMHRDLRADVQLTPGASLVAEQRACDRWRQEFNQVRPHEALQGKVPAELYRPSERRETRPLSYGYPAGWIIRRVNAIGRISIEDERYTVTRALAGQIVGLEPKVGLRYQLWFRELDLGQIELSASHTLIEEAIANFEQRPLRRARSSAASRASSLRSSSAGRPLTPPAGRAGKAGMPATRRSPAAQKKRRKAA